MTFFSWLEERCRQINSLLCIGLDPYPDELQAPTVEAAVAHCLNLIEQTADLAAAFKLNIAFFEVFGAQGWEALRTLITNIPSDIPLILDAKRGDIPSTAQAYARSAFDELGAHAVTVNPYLGRDSVEPFLSYPERGVFLLCKTSNPGAMDFQDRELAQSMSANLTGKKLKLFELVARKAVEWNTKENIGLVVGATQPEALSRVRELAPAMWILAPGVGAQGGNLRVAINIGLRKDGLGLLVPISRGISRRKDVHAAANEYRLAIQGEVSDMMKKNNFMVAQRERSSSRFDLASQLVASGCVRFGKFTLKSGLESPVYIDLRRLASFPGLLSLAAAEYIQLLRKIAFDRLAGIPYAALPITTAISLEAGWPMIYPRKESKTYGTKESVEGVFEPGENVVVIDDLATTGASKFEAIDKLTAAGLQVKDIVVLIDRQSGAAESLAKAGYSLHSVYTLRQLCEIWRSSGLISEDQENVILDFIENTSTSTPS